MQNPTAMYKPGGNDDVWGRKMTTVTVDESQVSEMLADGWYLHPNDVPEDQTQLEKVKAEAAEADAKAATEAREAANEAARIEQERADRERNQELMNLRQAQATRAKSIDTTQEKTTVTTKTKGELELAAQQAIQEQAKAETAANPAVQAEALARIADDAIAGAKVADGDTTREEDRLRQAEEAAGAPAANDGMKEALEKAAEASSDDQAQPDTNKATAATPDAGSGTGKAQAKTTRKTTK